MGVPYFYVIALIAAVGETIPIVGPIIGGITAVAVAITVSPKLALMVGVYFLVLHQLEANVLVPKIMERRVGVSPVVVMVALLIGGALWGLVGAILAIPTAAILSVIVSSSRAKRTSGFSASGEYCRRSNAEHAERAESFVFVCELGELVRSLFTSCSRWRSRGRWRAGSRTTFPSDFGDPLFTAWVMAWDATHLGPRVVEREHLPSAPARARLLGAFSSRRRFRRCRSTRHENPILGYNVVFLSTFVLSGLGMFLLRPRSDRTPGGRDRGRARVRLRAVPDRVAAAPAGAVVGVDAVRAARLAPLSATGRTARRCRGGRRMGRAEPFVRLLPLFFSPVVVALRRLGTHGAAPLDERPGPSRPSPPPAPRWR